MITRTWGGSLPRVRPTTVYPEREFIDDLSPVAQSVCCIYHKARKFGESSSEESSSDSDSDSDCGRSHHHHRHHQSADGDGGAERERNGECAQVEELESDGEPNAYERPPGWKKNKGKRKADGELRDVRPADSLLTQRSLMDLPSVTHHANRLSSSQGRCELDIRPYLRRMTATTATTYD